MTKKDGSTDFGMGSVLSEGDRAAIASIYGAVPPPPTPTPPPAPTRVAPPPPTVPAAQCGVLLPNQSLGLNQEMWSCDHRFHLVLQGQDGNLVLYGPSGALWWTLMAGPGAAGTNFVVQGDGNVVLYSWNGVAVWNTRTNRPGSRLAIQDDGNLVVYAPDDTVMWRR